MWSNYEPIIFGCLLLLYPGINAENYPPRAILAAFLGFKIFSWPFLLAIGLRSGTLRYFIVWGASFCVLCAPFALLDRQLLDPSFWVQVVTNRNPLLTGIEFLPNEATLTAGTVYAASEFVGFVREPHHWVRWEFHIVGTRIKALMVPLGARLPPLSRWIPGLGHPRAKVETSRKNRELVR
jgi:hypothetical protein